MKDRVWLAIAILSLLTGLIWVGITAWSASHGKKLPADVQQAVSSLSPTLDTDELKAIQLRSM